MSTVQSRKSKGRRLQQYLRDIILENFPNLEPDDVRSTPMGSSGTDLMMSPKAQKVFPFAPECKNQESLSIWAALKQAEKNSTDKLIPLLIFKRNNTKTYAVLELKKLIEILKNNNKNE